MMDIVKKNLLSIICGIVILLALIASFYPLGGYMTELKGKLDGRVAKAGEVEGMASKARVLPVVNPDTTETQPLTSFPTDAIIKKGDDITKQVETESKKMRDAAVAMNYNAHLDPVTKQVLMVPGSLPSPTSSTGIQFRERYKVLMPQPVLQQPAPVQPGQPIVVAPLHPLTLEVRGAVPVSTIEITQAQETAAKEIADKSGNIAANKAAVDAAIALRRAQIPDEMQTNVAKKSMVYVDPAAWEVNAVITAGAGAPDSTLKALWYRW